NSKQLLQEGVQYKAVTPHLTFSPFDKPHELLYCYRTNPTSYCHCLLIGLLCPLFCRTTKEQGKDVQVLALQDDEQNSQRRKDLKMAATYYKHFVKHDRCTTRTTSEHKEGPARKTSSESFEKEKAKQADNYPKPLAVAKKTAKPSPANKSNSSTTSLLGFFTRTKSNPAEEVDVDDSTTALKGADETGNDGEKTKKLLLDAGDEASSDNQPENFLVERIQHKMPEKVMVGEHPENKGFLKLQRVQRESTLNVEAWICNEEDALLPLPSSLTGIHFGWGLAGYLEKFIVSNKRGIILSPATPATDRPDEKINKRVAEEFRQLQQPAARADINPDTSSSSSVIKKGAVKNPSLATSSSTGSGKMSSSSTSRPTWMRT
ncbi:unnamed protein product, partial [Amoebophrya sp. A120]